MAQPRELITKNLNLKYAEVFAKGRKEAFLGDACEELCGLCG
jgi:hypothetical protein